MSVQPGRCTLSCAQVGPVAAQEAGGDSGEAPVEFRTEKEKKKKKKKKKKNFAPLRLLLGPFDSAAQAARTSLQCRREPNSWQAQFPTYAEGVLGTLAAYHVLCSSPPPSVAVRPGSAGCPHKLAMQAEAQSPTFGEPMFPSIQRAS
ncbi:unnamed protein product [Prorocentrum cordatum]|uniref:Uncharacterized protein n=1 Tax=Prorocentrum cordatum TaxID=2364126 RepID=A0ABN9WIZ1_9DINO|nr:unnamed protein product [Polarella glacialis]